MHEGAVSSDSRIVAAVYAVPNPRKHSVRFVCQLKTDALDADVEKGIIQRRQN
jgi:hypothetical protein